MSEKDDGDVLNSAVNSPIGRDAKSYIQLIALVLILSCLLSLFGGKVLGSWYTTKGESSSEGYVNSGQVNYGLTTYYVEGTVNGEEVLEDDILEVDYEDWDCYCGETEDVMGNTKSLVYLNTLAGFGLIFFIRYQKFNGARIVNLFFVIIIISLLTSIYFISALPDAIDKDDGSNSIYQNQHEDASFVSFDEEISVDGGNTVMKAMWYPNLGFLYLIINLILCFSGLAILDYDFKKIFGSLDD